MKEVYFQVLFARPNSKQIHANMHERNPATVNPQVLIFTVTAIEW